MDGGCQSRSCQTSGASSTGTGSHLGLAIISLIKRAVGRGAGASACPRLALLWYLAAVTPRGSGRSALRVQFDSRIASRPISSKSEQI
jgi:hypothetical protein